MAPSFSLLAILSLLGAGQAVLLAAALWRAGRGATTAANRLLAALVLTVAVFIVGAVVRTTNYVFVYPHLSRLHDPFPFLAGPLLYLYLRALFGPGPALRRRDLWHFAPFALCAAYLAPYFFQGAPRKLELLTAEFYQEGMGLWYYVRSALVLAHFLVYLTLTVRLFLRRPRGAGEGGPAFAQARFLLASCLVLCAAALLRFAFDQTAGSNLLVPLGVSMMVYGLGYMRLVQTAPAGGAKEAGAAASFPPPAVPKYGRSTLTPERAERHLRRLLHVMETEKPYTDGELSLQKLSERLAIPPQHLSQTINERLRQSFSDFVNAYRVEEVKRRLQDPARGHYSILAIAEEVGFNSKSAFNAVFKKHAGMTPSEFRKATADADGHGNGHGRH